MNKKQRLLNEMVSIYVRDGEPIGSESLRLTMGIKISSSTIRNYFKIFVDEGILLQPHISSGRIPADDTLKDYWRKNINLLNIISISNIDKVQSASNKYGVFCNIKIVNNQILREVIDYNKQYIILLFSDDEVILKYTSHVFSFMTELIGQSIDDIKSISRSVCANSIFYKLNSLSGSQVFNCGYEFLRNIDENVIVEILNGHIYYRLRNGFYFNLSPDGYLCLIQDVTLDNNYGKMLIFGKLRCNYTDFYHAIAS